MACLDSIFLHEQWPALKYKAYKLLQIRKEKKHILWD